MMRFSRVWIVGAIGFVFLVTFALALLLFNIPVKSLVDYPSPVSMPLDVDGTLQDQLARLEQVLARRAPKTHSALQAGLSREKITALESESGLHLTGELRILYSWHNGMESTSKQGLFSIYSFPSLERIVAEQAARNQAHKKQTFIQRTFSLPVGYRKSWIDVFPDGSGDGYFVDTQRDATSGAVFYNFLEDGEYVFYPSLKNLIAAISEGYERGVYSDEMSLDEDLKVYQLRDEIHQKYGSQILGQ